LRTPSKVRRASAPRTSSGRTQVDNIAGLAEVALASGGSETDLTNLLAVVVFAIDDLFPIVNALTIVGFGRVQGLRLDPPKTGEHLGVADIQPSQEWLTLQTIDLDERNIRR
jgi:hypothetical protein